MKFDCSSIATRRWVSENVDKSADELDLSQVEFVSRAACDEILHQCSKNSINIVSPQDEVRKMIEVLLESHEYDLNPDFQD